MNRPDALADLSDAALAAELAEQAGRLLVELRASGLEGTALGDAGDAQANALLLTGLAAARPGDAVLSEESADDPARLQARRLWIIDPLDGTREYREPPRTDWAVHVALWEDGVLTAGAVALPGLGTVLGTEPAPPLAAAVPGPIRMVVSRTRPPAFTQTVADVIGAVLVPMGSAGAKATSVLLGSSDVYLHDGGQYEWDSAAPVAVCQAAGLHCSRIDGSPLVYNRELRPWLPDLLICRPELADIVLAAVRSLPETPA